MTNAAGMNNQSSEELRNLMESVRQKNPVFRAPPEDLFFNWIMYQSSWPWLELLLNVPHEKMFKEAMALSGSYVPHRQYDSTAGYNHSGWKSLCVHGLGTQKN